MKKLVGTIIYLHEKHEITDWFNSPPITVKEKDFYVPHMFYEGDDLGEINNYDYIECKMDLETPKSIPNQNFVVEQVCAECLDEGDMVDSNPCTCYVNRTYKTVEVINVVCKCCGHKL